MNSLFGGYRKRTCKLDVEGNADTEPQLVLTGAEEITMRERERERETYRLDGRESERKTEDVLLWPVVGLQQSA
jgi:hypothetical protein